MYQIETKNTNESELIVRLLYAFGYEHMRDQSVEKAIEDFNGHGAFHPWVKISPKRKTFGGNYHKQEDIQVLNNYTELADLLVKPTTVEVKLNNEHTAIVKADSIQVGCQSFPIDILDKLNEARATLKS